MMISAHIQPIFPNAFVRAVSSVQRETAFLVQVRFLDNAQSALSANSSGLLSQCAKNT